MDEHIRIFSGTTITVEEGNQVDANLNDLTWWTEKHNGYATREMADMLMMEYGLDDRGKEVQAKFWGTEEQRKRWLKVKYIKAPLFLRPFINFNIRYILKGGFWMERGLYMALFTRFLVSFPGRCQNLMK